MLELWSINRVLRWTGFRAMVQTGKDTPTRVGVVWVGLYGSKGWMRWEPDTRPFWRAFAADSAPTA